MPIRWSRPFAGLRRFWSRSRWFFVGALAIANLLLGYVGFRDYYLALGSARPPLDLFYYSLQLFVLESGGVPAPHPWQLEVARLLAPAIAAYTIVVAVAQVFRQQIQLLRLRFLRHHVVICGLGRRGTQVVRSFLRGGHRVVAIEKDDTNPHIRGCREAGATVLIGDARDPEILGIARPQRALLIVVVCDQDGINAEVAAQVRAITPKRKSGKLTCLVHLVEPEICRLLQTWELSVDQAEPLRLDFFNVFDLGARVLLDEHPPVPESSSAEPPHILVVGTNQLAERLVLRLVHCWRTSKLAHPPRLTLYGRRSAAALGRLHRRYPRLSESSHLSAAGHSSADNEPLEADDLLDGIDAAGVSAAYICSLDESRTLASTLALQERLLDRGVPVVSCTLLERGLATFVERPTARRRTVSVFGLLDRTCRPEFLLADTIEKLARGIHARYRRTERENGVSLADNPSLVRWTELPEDLKESNRSQAEHIGEKLASLGYAIVTLTDWDDEVVRFSSSEIEHLAQLEHERWVTDRRARGWKFAPGEKDLVKKTHPDLVAWADLSEEEREKDRATVRALPDLLAEAGFRIVRPPGKRVDPAATRTPPPRVARDREPGPTIEA